MSELNMNELEQVAGGKGAGQTIKATGDRFIPMPPHWIPPNRCD